MWRCNDMSARSGIVKWFNRLKGYGFIEDRDSGEEIFVHYSSIEGDSYRNLQEGDRVDYDLIDKGKGLQAKNVRPRRFW